MKVSIVPYALLAVGLFLVATPARALISLAYLTIDEARELGISMKQRPNGDAGTKVWIEFRKEGFLEAFDYCELRVRDADGAHRLSTRLAEHRVVHGQAEDRLSFSFSAAADQLKYCEFWVVAYHSPRGDVGYILEVAEFLDIDTSGAEP